MTFVLFLDLTSIKCEDDSTQTHRQKGFLPFNKMWHPKDVKPTGLLDQEVQVKQQDHSDGDINDGETIVKQKYHYGGDINDGETIVKQEDHSDGDTNDGETILKQKDYSDDNTNDRETIIKEEAGETIVKEEAGETRHWVVCDGGFLNEIKKHHTWSVETSTEENQRRVDNNISYIGAAPTTLEACTSSAFTKDVTSSCHPNRRETIHTGVKAYTCSTCGKSFSNLSSHS